MKTLLPILIVAINFLIFIGTAYCIVSYAYREDIYGVPMGTPVTGTEVLIKVILSCLIQTGINLVIHNGSNNTSIKKGIVFSGGTFIIIVIGFILFGIIK